jgi:hypothetical protein
MNLEKMHQNYRELLHLVFKKFVLPASYEFWELMYIQMRFYYDYCFPLFMTYLIVWALIVKYRIRKKDIRSFNFTIKKFPDLREYLKNIENEKLEILKNEIELVIKQNIYLNMDYKEGKIEIPYDVEIKYLYVHINNFWKFFFSFYEFPSRKLKKVNNFQPIPNFDFIIKKSNYRRYSPRKIQFKRFLDMFYEYFIKREEDKYIREFFMTFKKDVK